MSMLFPGLERCVSSGSACSTERGDTLLFAKRERDMRDAGPECRFDTCRSSLPFICGVIFHNRVAGSTFNGAASITHTRTFIRRL